VSDFSDYIVYADESGSPALGRSDPDYPVFVVAFIVVRKSVYCEKLVPALQKLKFEFFGHDQIILHERDIRRQGGAFTVLRNNPETRDAFLQSVTDFVQEADLCTIACAIRINHVQQSLISPATAYDLAVGNCLRQLGNFLSEKDQLNLEVPVIFEARGHAEDRALELEFRRQIDAKYYTSDVRLDTSRKSIFPMFADKRSNSSGLQIADLFARPIGLKALNPDRRNRAFDTLSKKLYGGEFMCPF
jgi:hypothetical protein